MFFEQHSLEPNLGAAYFWLTLVKGGRELQQHALEDWMEEGERALGVMERHLAEHRYFAADRYTIADIALYAYTHVAHMCDYDLSRFPGGACLAQAGGGRAAPRTDGLAAGRCTDRRPIARPWALPADCHPKQVVCSPSTGLMASSPD